MKNSATQNSEYRPEGNNQAKHKKHDDNPFYNCHTHIFNFEHVNSGFLKGMIPLWVGFAAIVLAALPGYFVYEIITQFLSLNWVWMILKGILAVLFLLVSFLLLLVFLFSVFPINIHKLFERNRIRNQSTKLVSAAQIIDLLSIDWSVAITMRTENHLFLSGQKRLKFCVR
jgi:Ni,Fe-hydrogenase I cytochrome b subunit